MHSPMCGRPAHEAGERICVYQSDWVVTPKRRRSTLANASRPSGGVTRAIRHEPALSRDLR
jgi:hypothetical protein